MDYVIKNSKNVFIRLNNTGSPVSCTDQEKTLFEYSKAKNVLDNLPKTLKRLNFKVEAVPDIISIKTCNDEQSFIKNENYIVSDEILKWLEKFGICDDIINEAKQRKDELLINLSNTDKEFSDIVHKIEFKNSIDLYGAWKEWKKIKENRKKRRRIKDELIVITSVIKMDFRSISRNNLKKTIDGLALRKYKLRITEDGDEQFDM